MTKLPEYNHDKLHETIRCQRNWDWDNQVTPEHLAIIDEYVEKPPQQQGQQTFSIVRIHNDLEKISYLHDRLYSPQSQILAPLVYVWFPLHPGPNHHDRQKCQYQLGFHAGIISKLANSLGYATGFCGCGPDFSRWHQVQKKFSLYPPEAYAFPQFILSIGRGKPDTEYNIDQNNDFVHQYFPYNWPPVKNL